MSSKLNRRHHPPTSELELEALRKERDSWRRVAERLETEKVTAEARLAEAMKALEAGK